MLSVVNLCLQVIFFWAYVTRNICVCFDSMPSLRSALPQAQRNGRDHQISLSEAQQGQVCKDCVSFIAPLQHCGYHVIFLSSVEECCQ